MYTVEQAVRIALLENTGIDELAIKSVIAAVKGLIEPPAAVKGEDRSKWSLKDWYEHVGAWEDDRDCLCFGSPMALNAMLIQMAKARNSTPVVGWIIERVGHPVSMTHYKTVADSQRSMGATVTEHHARV